MSHHSNAASLVTSLDDLRNRRVQNPDAGLLSQGHKRFLIRHNAFFQQQLIQCRRFGMFLSLGAVLGDGHCCALPLQIFQHGEIVLCTHRPGFISQKIFQRRKRAIKKKA